MMIADKLQTISNREFAVPPNGDCSELLNIPGTLRLRRLEIDGQPLHGAEGLLAELQAEAAEPVAPCDICGRDCYQDIVVSWVSLFNGQSIIKGYRLCDECNRVAMKEEKERGELSPEDAPFIEKAVLVHRTNNRGVTESPERWRELCSSHCGFL